MSAPPLLTVILPVYNCQDTIFSALHSLFNQSFQDFEILLLEDGSTDQTFSIVKSIPDHRIHVIHDQVNKGLTMRLNQGIALARGKYIARMDGDDFSFPLRFAKQIAFLEAHPEIDLLSTRAIAFKDIDYTITGLLPYKQSHAEITKHLWNTIYMPHPTWMGKTSWFKNNLYKTPEVKRVEDQELLLRTSAHSQFHCLDDVLLAYRQRHVELGKIIATRKNLFNTQLNFFLHQKQWSNLANATSAFFIKSTFDYLASVPYLNSLIKKQKTTHIPEDIMREIQQHIKTIIEIEKNA